MNALTKQADVDAGILLAAAPDQLPVNAAGAGDTVSGALVWRLAGGDPWPAALRRVTVV